MPVKVNVVVQRGLNEGSILDIARRFRGTGHPVRFIEYMDVGATNGWRLDDVVPAAEIVAAIGAEFPLEPVEAAYRGEVAERYRYLDGAGEIGVIASVTQPFCGDCTRARISADGKLYTCLFALRGRPACGSPLGCRGRQARDRDPRRLDGERTLFGASHGRETGGLRKVEMSYIGARRRFDGSRPSSPENTATGLERRGTRAHDERDQDDGRGSATAICTVISSPSSAQPRKTATIGFTYAYVATSEMGATRSSQT